MVMKVHQQSHNNNYLKIIVLTVCIGISLVWLFPAYAMDPGDANQMAAINYYRNYGNPDAFRILIDRGMIESADLDIMLYCGDDGPYQQCPSPESAAEALFWGSYGADFLSVADPLYNFRLKRRAGLTLHYDQYYEDIPVYGAWLQMTAVKKLREDLLPYYVIKHISGRYIPHLNLAQLTAHIPANVAVDKVSENIQNSIKLTLPPKLWIYDEALFAPECEGCPKVAHNPRLAWRVIFFSPKYSGGMTDAFVDALNGNVLSVIPRNSPGAWTDIEDANFQYDNNCFKDTNTVALFDGSSVCNCSSAANIGEGEELCCYAEDLYNFYNDLCWFEFQISDEDESVYTRCYNGALMEMYINVANVPGPFGPQNPWRNAQSRSCGTHSQLLFGSAAVSKDVFGHEFGHSVHRAAVPDTPGTGDPRAVGEHIADMLGQFYSHYSDCNWVTCERDWLFGENSTLGQVAICGWCRNLADPGNLGPNNNPADMCSSGADMYDYNYHAGEWVPYWNSTILSRAGYLMTVGGQVGDWNIRGIGELTAKLIYYHALVRYLPKNPSLSVLRNAVVGACDNLTDKWISVDGPIATPDDCCQVRKAFAAVGFKGGDPDCDGIEEGFFDIDGDGRPDGADNCPFVPNPGQENRFGNGIGDACNVDVDGDGIPDKKKLDDYTYISFPPSYINGVNVGGDDCPYVIDNPQNPLACKDDDGDGIPDFRDNCGQYTCTPTSTAVCTDPTYCNSVPGVCIYPNTDQNDTDHDGMGDACDPDIDGDGIPNNIDNCRYTYTPNMNNDPCCNICNPGCDNPLKKVVCNNPVYPSQTPQTISFPSPKDLILQALDISSVITPDAYYIFKPQDQLRLSLTLSLNGLASAAPSLQPFIVRTAVLDESGNSVAEGEVDLDTGSFTKSMDMTFGINPSYNIRQQAPVTYAAAVTTTSLKQAGTSAVEGAFIESSATPSYYLAISIAPRNAINAALLNTLSLDVTMTAMQEWIEIGDNCPDDPNKFEPGVCGCGVPDTDSDGDGTPDCLDQCPNDPNKIAPGVCGCGNPDTDTDGDGVADCIDNCPNIKNADQADRDGDGKGNVCDPIEVPLDIKPTSCPNPLLIKDLGDLPVAILGTSSFNVADIDRATIRLEGVAPIGNSIKDVATPFAPFTGKVTAKDCTTAGPDGIKDLMLKFKTTAIVKALGPVNDKTVRVLHLTGKLNDGTPILGEDVMLINKK